MLLVLRCRTGVTIVRGDECVAAVARLSNYLCCGQKVIFRVVIQRCLHSLTSSVSCRRAGQAPSSASPEIFRCAATLHVIMFLFFCKLVPSCRHTNSQVLIRTHKLDLIPDFWLLTKVQPTSYTATHSYFCNGFYFDQFSRRCSCCRPPFLALRTFKLVYLRCEELNDTKL